MSNAVPQHLSLTNERFWSKVDKRGPGECWPWKAGVDKDGYGKFHITIPGSEPRRERERSVRAHRVSFALIHGREPDGLVLHSCDNPPCCNPAHLRDGTQLENRAEAVAKGRVPRGEKHHAARIDESVAREIIRLKREGASLSEIAHVFGLNKSHVHLIGTYSWLHLMDGAA